MKDFCFKHVVLFIVLFMIMCLVFHDHLFHLFNEITLHFYLHYNAIVAAATIMLFVLLFVFIMYCNQEKYEALIKNDVEIYRKDVVAFMSDTPSDTDLLKRDRYAKLEVIIYGNGDIEWNNRFNTVYFSAIYFNNHQNLQNLYNAYSNLGNVISDLNSWHDSASKSLQGFTLNSAYFEFVKQ